MMTLLYLSLGVAAGLVLILLVMRHDFKRDKREQEKEEYREFQDSYYD